jgi:hypothetical protein
MPALSPMAESTIAECLADQARLDLNPVDVREWIAWLLVDLFGYTPDEATDIAREHVPLAIH